MSDTPLARYLNHLAVTPNRRGRLPAQASVRAARADLTGFAAWWQDTHQLATFDPALVQERDLLDWQEHRQVDDGAAVTTINRAAASLRAFFDWALDAGLTRHNPARRLRDLPVEDTAPPHFSPEALTWLFREVEQLPAGMQRQRDLTLLALLSGCGLRSDEAGTLQVRDLDLDGATVTVRRGKGGRTRRVPLEQETLRRLRDYVTLRCPDGMPEVGTPAERELLLMGFHRRPGWEGWTPGMTTAAMRKRLRELGAAAAKRVEEQAHKEQRLTRLGELEGLARQLRAVSPHQLRHSLAYRLRRTMDLGAVGAILGHTSTATTKRYGLPTEQDLRAGMREANDLSAARRQRERA